MACDTWLLNHTSTSSGQDWTGMLHCSVVTECHVGVNMPALTSKPEISVDCRSLFFPLKSNHLCFKTFTVWNSPHQQHQHQQMPASWFCRKPEASALLVKLRKPLWCLVSEQEAVLHQLHYSELTIAPYCGKVLWLLSAVQETLLGTYKSPLPVPAAVIYCQSVVQQLSLCILSEPTSGSQSPSCLLFSCTTSTPLHANRGQGFIYFFAKHNFH